MAHRQLDRRAARKLAEAHYEEAFDRVVPPSLEEEPGVALLEYENDYAARVERNGRRQLVVSTLPLRAPDAQGRKTAVDFDLVRRGAAFGPANSLVDARMPEALRDGIAVGGELTVHPELAPGAGMQNGEIAGASVFYPEVAADTDFLVRPLPLGIETFHQIRSLESPERHALRLDLPRGASLRASTDGGAEIVKTGEVVGRVYPPVAKDAQGQEVAISLAVDQDSVVLAIPHRDRDYAYPILADPVIEYFEHWLNSGVDFQGWYSLNDSGRYSLQQYSGNPCYGNCRGLYVFANPGVHYPGIYGQWRFDAPNYTSYFSEVIFYLGMRRNNGQPGPQMHHGLWSYRSNNWAAGSASSTDYYAGSGSNAIANYSSPSDQFYQETRLYGGYDARLALHSMWIGWQTRNQYAHAYVGGARLSLEDPEIPTISAVSEGLKPQGWVGAVSRSGRITAWDPGLGVRRVTLHMPRWETPRDICSGERYSRCRAEDYMDISYGTDSGAMNEGYNTVGASAHDALWRWSGRSNWTVKVDRSVPTVDVPSGPLWNAQDKVIGDGTYTVGVTARDAYSGVKAVELKVDNNVVSTLGDCGSDACPQNGTLTWNSGEFAGSAKRWTEGPHTISIGARDRVGSPAANEASAARTWQVYVDRSAPEIQAVSGPMRDRRYLKAETYDLTVSATDGSSQPPQNTAGVTKMELLVDGSVPAEPDPSQPRYTKVWDCPERGCTRTHTFNLDASTLAQGAHSVSVRVTDGVGNPTTSAPWDVVVDHEAPQVTPSGTLKDNEDQALLEPEYGLHVEATDASSSGARAGVDSIEYLLEDERQGEPVRQTCPPAQDNCALSGDFTFRTADHEDGIYTVGARATDRAGNSAEVAWDVYDDSTKRRSLEREAPDDDGYEVKRLRTFEPGTQSVQSRTYLNETGLHRESVRRSNELHDGPDGESEPNVNALSLDQGSGVYRNGAGDYTAEIPTSASRPVRFSAGGEWVEFGLVGAAGAASVDGSTARFTNVLGAVVPPGVDLTYEALGEGLKEEIVLNRPLLSPAEFRFDLTLSLGLTPTANPDGGIDFVGADGVRRFGFEAPIMVDGSESPAGFSRAVTMTLGPVTAGRSTVTLTPDRAWVVSPLRVGPVVIDPTLTRKTGRSWDPLLHTLAFGNTTWISDAQCCERFAPEPNDEDFEHEVHPEIQDFAAMAKDGLEYSRLGIFPCATYGRDRWEYYDRYFRTAARRSVQLLPRIEQGLDCGGPRDVDGDGNNDTDGNLAPGKNPPSQPLEFEDMRLAGVELARQYGPIQTSADGALVPDTGRFWVASGCLPTADRCDTDRNGVFGNAGDLWYVPVRAWQVWNEPNIAKGWDGGNPEADEPDGTHDPINPAHYRETLRSTRAGLISVDPRARIVAAGLGAQRTVLLDGQPNTGAYRYGARQFLTEVLDDTNTPQAGDHNCLIDAAAMHVYRHETLYERRVTVNGKAEVRTQTAERPKTVRKFLSRSYRDVLDDNGARDVPIWITEFGAATDAHPTDKPGEIRDENDNFVKFVPPPGNTVTEEVQAEWVQGVVTALTGRDRGMNWRTTLGVGPMFHFAWGDNRFAANRFQTRLAYAARSGLWREPGATLKPGGPEGDERTSIKTPDGSTRVRKLAGGVAATLGRAAKRLALPAARKCPGETVPGR